MKDFIIMAIIMTIVVGIFLSLIIVNIFAENSKSILKKIVGVIIAIAIGCGISGLFTLEKRGDEIAWNNGYCTECEHPYRFANTEYHKNARTTYIWVCDNCGKIIELHNKYSK